MVKFCRKSHNLFWTYTLIQKFICNHMIVSFMLHPLFPVENHVFDNNRGHELEMHSIQFTTVQVKKMKEKKTV